MLQNGVNSDSCSYEIKLPYKVGWDYRVETQHVQGRGGEGERI